MTRRWRWPIRRLILYYVLVLCASAITGSVPPDNEPDSSVNESPSSSLWSSVLRDCKDPSVDCLTHSVYRYIDNALDTTSDSVNITSFLKIIRHNETAAATAALQRPLVDQAINVSSGRSSPIEDMAAALQQKTARFMATHDLEMALPEFLFGGSVLKLSPRSLDVDGAMLKLDLLPRESSIDFATPRIFFKKIKKFVGNKLLVALLAILLVIKLVVIKFMFFLPMIMGVAAAKKLLLKAILFLFPFLGHLFKLCPYYSPTKFHHHHHQISHVHKVPGLHKIPHDHLHGVELDHPPPGYETHYDTDVGYYSDGPSFNDHRKVFNDPKAPGGIGVIVGGADEPGDYPYAGTTTGQGQPHQTLPQQLSAPGKKANHYPLSPTDIENMVLKAEKEAMLKARLQEEQKRVDSENKRLQDQIKSSLKLQEKLKLQSIIAKQNSKLQAAATMNHPTILHAAGGVLPQQVLHPPPQYVTAIHPASGYIAAAPQPMQQHHPSVQQVHQMPQMHQVHQVPQMHQVQHVQQMQQLHATHTPMNEVHSVLYPTPPQSLSQVPIYVQSAMPKIDTAATAAANYDSFYSPILDKIDKILIGLSFNDEPCRERLICSMYKNPTKFSPHSNLISAELSRDADELQKPASSNAAVIRFYKYVQAARDGQDKRDCVRLYPACSINTD